MKTNIHTDQLEDGFSAVELLITIIVAAMFTVSFYMLFTAVNSATALARNRNTASELSYSYLRKYASAGATPDDWFVCSTASGASNTNDLSVNSAATGQVLTSGTLVPTTVSLPGPVTYSVTALAIYGCSAANLEKPIRVESKITFGPQNTIIKHSTLVGY